MPEGKTIEFADGEYPELDGLPSGSEVKFSGAARIQDNGEGAKSLVISSMEFETEGMADRELRSMSGQNKTTSAPDDNGVGDDF